MTILVAVLGFTAGVEFLIIGVLLWLPCPREAEAWRGGFRAGCDAARDADVTQHVTQMQEGEFDGSE